MAGKRLTKATRWNIKCGKCGYEGKTYSFGDQAGYGRLLGKTIYNEFAEFNAWDDPVFQELSSLVDNLIPRGEQKDSICFHHVLGFACDPAPSGEQYTFTGEIKCPNCDNDRIKYGPDNPPVIEVVNIPLVTHAVWKQFSNKGKRELINRELHSIGCLP